jgi:hypothetical protein
MDTMATISRTWGKIPQFTHVCWHRRVGLAALIVSYMAILVPGYLHNARSYFLTNPKGGRARSIETTEAAKTIKTDEQQFDQAPFWQV